uniref:G-protein coupled receptors family 1 profile domain-containing protein n=1 Tax=Ditylenchus dipsaci TaxID=166011 RepID=A0A915D2A4_9BILA
MVYIFPIQLIVGLIGNTLNLVVLLNRRMRTKTNILLAMVALADILFLLFMLPHTLMYHNKLMKIGCLKRFIVYGNNHITGVVNTCSFASAWLIVVVSIERMMAILFPLRSRTIWTWRNSKIIIASIWLVGTLASMHSHITHTVVMVARNESIVNKTTGLITEVVRHGYRTTLRSPLMEQYWRVGTIVNVMLMVIIPVLIVLVSNTLMVVSLRSKHKEQEFMAHIKNHKKATFNVLIIASTFSLCQIPSAIKLVTLQSGTSWHGRDNRWRMRREHSCCSPNTGDRVVQNTVNARYSLPIVGANSSKIV